jgi:pilus assembly protein FimV
LIAIQKQQFSRISMGQSKRQKTKNLKVKALSALVFSAWAWPVVALDLGRLQILSAIGEPLRAEIEVAQASPEELRSLRAQLASPGAFSQAGMEFNPALNGVTASLQTRPNGAAYIALNGRAPIQENFIDLILETQSSSGKLTKNYALLLNSVSERVTPSITPPPPANNPRVLGLAPVNQEPALQRQSTQPIRTIDAPTSSLNPTSVELNDRQIPVYRFAPVDNVQAPTATTRSNESSRPSTANLKAPAVQANPRAEGETSRDKTIMVKTGDTASRLALRYLGSNVSLDQMMLAMLKANPDAFIQGNVNLVKAGAVLRIPDTEEATQIPRAEARKTVIAQAKEFAEYARRLAESPLLVDSKNSRAMSGKVTTGAEKTETPTAQQDKLTLSKSSVASTAAEAKIASEREAKDTSDQLAALNKNMKDLEALAQKPTAPITTASLTPPPAAAPPANVATVPQVTSPTPPSTGSSLKDLSENKQLWAWAAALLAAVLLVAFWMRKKSTEPESIYAPSYDDIATPSAEPVMETASNQVSVPAQMSAIDLNLQPHASAAPVAPTPFYAAPTQAAPATVHPIAEDTEQSKLNLASQLLAKGDKDLARALILSVVSSTHGDIKARAIQMLGQIR